MMQAIGEVRLGEPLGVLCAVLAGVFGMTLLALGSVGLTRRSVSRLTAEVLAQAAEASNELGRASEGSERRKRLLRLSSVAGRGDPERWDHFVRELSLLDPEPLQDQWRSTLDSQLLCDAVGRELEARLAQGGETARAELAISIRRLFEMPHAPAAIKR